MAQPLADADRRERPVGAARGGFRKRVPSALEVEVESVYRADAQTLA